MEKSDDKMEPLYHSKSSEAKGTGQYRAHVIKPRSADQRDAEGARFEADLKEILRKGDVFGFRNFLAKSGRTLPTEMMLDTVKMETMLHQLTLSMPDLANVHARSKAWLSNNTVLKARGLTLLQSSRLTPSQKQQLIISENTEPHSNEPEQAN